MPRAPRATGARGVAVAGRRKGGKVTRTLFPCIRRNEGLRPMTAPARFEVAVFSLRAAHSFDTEAAATVPSTLTGSSQAGNGQVLDVDEADHWRDSPRPAAHRSSPGQPPRPCWRPAAATSTGPTSPTAWPTTAP